MENMATTSNATTVVEIPRQSKLAQTAARKQKFEKVNQTFLSNAQIANRQSFFIRIIHKGIF